MVEGEARVASRRARKVKALIFPSSSPPVSAAEISPNPSGPFRTERPTRLTTTSSRRRSVSRRLTFVLSPSIFLLRVCGWMDGWPRLTLRSSQAKLKDGSYKNIASVKHDISHAFWNAKRCESARSSLV